MAQVAKVGLLGLGTVGSGVFKILSENREGVREKAGVDLEVARILVRDVNKQRPGVDPALLTTDPRTIVADPDIDLVVEVLGGEEPARTYIEEALQAGKQVVTANKEIIAKHGVELLALARERGTDLFFEASVAGGIPILRPLQESLAGEEIELLYGIVNGTTNYILTAMSTQGRPFQEVLAEAQAKGYAEADPTADIGGHDAARKLAILAGVALNAQVPLEKVYCEGIESITTADLAIAAEMGYVVKLLAITRKSEQGVEARVHPAMIPAQHPLAAVNGVLNGILVRGKAVGTLMFSGAGAGQMPTGSAVVADLVASARNLQWGQKGRERTGFGNGVPVIPMDRVSTRYYLRLRVAPEPGVLGIVTRCFSDRGVELISLDVKNWGKESAHLIIRTGPVEEGIFRRALAEVDSQKLVQQVENTIRIEGEE